jgi:hypothetical protein
MPNYMGYREYATHRGCSLNAVQVAIRTHRIRPELIDGVKKIEAEQADKDWAENTDHSKIRHGNNKSPVSISQSKAVKEAYQARLAKLDYEVKSGKLVEKDKINRELFQKGRKVRDAILAVGSRIGSELAAETDPFKVDVILQKELTQALSELSEGE